MLDDDGGALGDIRTSAAGDARYLTQLVLRSYSVSDDPAQRRELLDVVDRMLEVGAYGNGRRDRRVASLTWRSDGNDGLPFVASIQDLTPMSP